MRQLELVDFTRIACPSCDEMFDSERGMKIHHKRIHGESIAGVEFDCDWCGETQRRCGSHVHEDMNNFCSPECRGAYRSEHYTGEDAPIWNGGLVELECEWCGGQYEINPAAAENSRFCSEECRCANFSEEYSGENAHTWRGGKVTIECDWCSTEIELYPSDAENRRFCSRDCYESWYSVAKTGENHQSWRGGKSIYDAVKKLISDRAFYTIADGIRDDAAHECEMCGRPRAENGRKLDVHHLVPLLAGGDNGEYNLTALCRSCHKKAEEYTKHHIPEIEPVLVE